MREQTRTEAGSWRSWAGAAWLAAVVLTGQAASEPAETPALGEPAAGSQRDVYFRLLAQYGRGDAASLVEANHTLESLLPKDAAAPVDAEDKFAHSAAVIFHRLYADKLPPALRARARFDVANRVKAIERYYYPRRRTNFLMGHSNFALLYLEAFVLGSEAVGDTAAAGRAYEAFNEFCDYTLHNGFTEFNAPNYYKVDMHCLGSLAGASANPQVRRRAAAFADWLWFDTALHYWPSQEWLSGANSRNYNYIGGLGGAVNTVRPYFGAEAEPPESRAAIRAKGGEAGWLASCDYEPPTYLREIAREKLRTVFQGLWLAPEPDDFRRGFEGEGFLRNAHGEFGHAYGKDRYTYVEPAYALGTSGSHYSSQDRTLVADLASRKPMASISFQINTRHPSDAAGDFLDFLGRSHLQTGAATVQDRNLALVMSSLSLPGAPESEKPVRIVAPLLLLPANVDRIAVNARCADARSGVHALSSGDVLYLQEGRVYASLRFIPAPEGFAGYQPTYHYRLDGRYEIKARVEGIRSRRTYPVGALVCVLYEGPRQAVTGTNVRSGFVVEMGTTAEYPTLADFREHIQKETLLAQTLDQGIWKVRYTSAAREISLAKDLGRDRVLDRRATGVQVQTPVHASSFSTLTNGILTITWKGTTHRVDLRK